MGFQNLINYETSESEVLQDLLLKLDLASSKRQARELISSGALFVNGEKITDTFFSVSADKAIGGVFTIIRKGKKTYSIIKHI